MKYKIHTLTLFLIIVNMIFLSIRLKNASYLYANPQGSISLSQVFEYSFESAFEDPLLDKLHGYHKVAEYLSNPVRLAMFIKEYYGSNERSMPYIECLENTEIDNRKLNAVAIFAEAYWKSVLQFYTESDNYERVKETKKSKIKIPFNRIDEDIFKLALIEDYIYVTEVTISLDTSSMLKDADAENIGRPVPVKDCILNGMSEEINGYASSNRIGNDCSNFLFTEQPIPIEIAFQNFEHTGINFGDFKKHFSQYHLSPKLDTKGKQVPMLRFNFLTELTHHNFAEVPIPITLAYPSHRKLYIKNAMRAVIGNLLKQGVSREFIVLVKLENESHREFFDSWLNDINFRLERNKELYRSVNNAQLRMSNESTIFSRFKLTPNHRKCESVNAINSAIDSAKNYILKKVNETPKTKNRYIPENIWPQVILIKPSILGEIRDIETDKK